MIKTGLQVYDYFTYTLHRAITK